MLKDILAITGQSGLFKVISRGSKNLIVESLLNGKRMPAHSTNKIISLDDIAIYTANGEKPLKEVLKLIADKEQSQQSIDSKSSGDVLKNYFKEILPDYDDNRVYVSDIKKVLNWYNVLQSKNMLNFEEVPEVDAEVEDTEQEKNEE